MKRQNIVKVNLSYKIAYLHNRNRTCMRNITYFLRGEILIASFMGKALLIKTYRYC